MAREKKKIIDIKLIIGILFMLVLLVGASYAYFSVEVNSTDYNKTIITGSTEGVSIASIQNPTTKLNLNVDGAAMSLDNLGTIYADDEENYVKTKSEGFHDIGVITLKNSEKDDNIYNCTANVTISIDNGANSILNYLQSDDLKVFIRWGVYHEIIDLSTIKDTGKTTMSISLDIVGNDSKSIEAYIELTNKETDQSYLSGKDINIDIDTTDLKCELTGERAVYLVSTGWANSLGQKMRHANDIKNVYFVDYINTTNAVEEPVDLTNTSTRDKYYSSAGSIIGWLEEISNENEEETQYYNLYIGSRKNSRIYATNMYYFYLDMNNLSSVSYNNFYTDVLTSFSESFYTWAHIHPEANFLEYNVSDWDVANANNVSAFHGMSSLQKLDVSNFNTKNATSMYSMFNGAKSITALDVSNFNTMKVTDMSNMFAGMSSLTELDVSSFYTSNVTTMADMFSGISKLTELDVSNFDTHNVTSMYSMFRGLTLITDLDLSNFDTKNVTDMRYMFKDMSSLEYLDLRNAEFNQVMEYAGMFSNIKKEITLIVKDEKNREWIQERLNEAGITGNVLLPSEIDS